MGLQLRTVERLFYKSIILILLGLSFQDTALIYAQSGLNLVQNSSFEHHDNLIPNISPFSIGSPQTCWTGKDHGMRNWYLITCHGSPDFFSTRSSGNQPNILKNGVPDNLMGSEPARTGDSYAGLITYDESWDDDREYLQQRLLLPLEKGYEYEAKLHISRGEDTSYGSNGMGMHFSTKPQLYYQPSFYQKVPGDPKVVAENIVLTESGWFAVKGTFVADSSYQYLTIGNFYGDDDPRFLRTNRMGLTRWSGGGYYFVDDVSVEKTGRFIRFTDRHTPDCTPVEAIFAIQHSGFAGETFHWDFGDGIELLTTDSIVSHSYENLGSYTVRLSLESETKSYYYEKEIIISGRNGVVADFATPDIWEIDIAVPIQNLSTGATIYQWSFGDGLSSIEAIPQHSYTAPGLYHIQLDVSNADSCTAQKDTVIQIIKPCGKPEQIPNMFSPNSDGINDIFTIESYQWCPGFLLTILDRWGRRVFTTTDPISGWNGIGATEGVYYYVIKTEVEIRKGSLTLIR